MQITPPNLTTVKIKNRTVLIARKSKIALQTDTKASKDNPVLIGPKTDTQVKMALTKTVEIRLALTVITVAKIVEIRLTLTVTTVAKTAEIRLKIDNLDTENLSLESGPILEKTGMKKTKGIKVAAPASRVKNTLIKGLPERIALIQITEIILSNLEAVLEIIPMTSIKDPRQ